MINATQAVNSSSSNSPSNGGSAASVAASSQDRFLKLLVTQLKNQDPLNPMDNAQMTSQMAQISTVSGIDRLNATLEALIASMTPNQTLQASSMIGHGVMAMGNGVTLTGGVGIGGFELTQPADNVKVSIYNQTGALVSSIDLGAQPAGISRWQWDGKDYAGAAMADGNYVFTVNASQAGGSVAATSYQFGVVNNVTQEANGAALGIGRLENIALSQVKQIY